MSTQEEILDWSHEKILGTSNTVEHEGKVLDYICVKRPVPTPGDTIYIIFSMHLMPWKYNENAVSRPSGKQGSDQRN